MKTVQTLFLYVLIEQQHVYPKCKSLIFYIILQNLIGLSNFLGKFFLFAGAAQLEKFSTRQDIVSEVHLKCILQTHFANAISRNSWVSFMSSKCIYYHV